MTDQLEKKCEECIPEIEGYGETKEQANNRAEEIILEIKQNELDALKYKKLVELIKKYGDDHIILCSGHCCSKFYEMKVKTLLDEVEKK